MLGHHFSMSDNFCDSPLAFLDDVTLAELGSTLNPWYSGRLLHCYMLDEPICHFRDVGSVLWLLSYF